MFVFVRLKWYKGLFLLLSELFELVKYWDGLTSLAILHLPYIPRHGRLISLTRYHRLDLMLVATIFMKDLSKWVLKRVVRVHATIGWDLLQVLQSMQLPFNCQSSVWVLRVSLALPCTLHDGASLEWERRLRVEGSRGIPQEVLPTCRVGRYLREDVGGRSAHWACFSWNSLVLSWMIVVYLRFHLGLSAYALRITGESLLFNEWRLT